MNTKNSSYLRSLTLGIAFAAAWTPCIGPILGILLTMAATTGSALQGGILLIFYSVGLGSWFLLFAIFTDFFDKIFKYVMPYSEKLMIFFGIIFCLLGLLLLTGNFTSLNQFFIKFGFFEPMVNIEQNLSNNINSFYGPLVAATAGVFSFFSPCVLPLIPVYFINLTGDMLSNIKAGNKFSPVSHALFFVGGFTMIFVALGTTAGILGGFFIDNLKVINQISGIVVLVLGIQMTGLIKIPFLDRTFNLS